MTTTGRAPKSFSPLTAATCLLLVGRVVSSASQTPNMFMVRFPAGEYRMLYDAFYPCQRDTSKDIFALNVYLSKKSRQETEIKGNMTFRAPIDDKLNFELNMASWGSTGGWKENSFLIQSENFCSTGRRLMGNKMWNNWLDGFNVTKKTCPIPPGVFVTSGLSTKTVDDHAFPKVYFYGKYRIFIMAKYKKDQRVAGCVALEGVYVTSGLSTKIIDDSDMPKVFFYGKYRVVLVAKNKTDQRVAGCVALEVRLVRPWEVPPAD